MDEPLDIDDAETDREWVPEPGEILAGKYEVERLLGDGGMGVVVAARHQQLGHRVAIKYLRPSVASDAPAVARFTREAQAAVALRGEHVARVQDVGTLDNGAPYMVMEFLSGIDLEVLLERKGSLGVEDAVDYLLQACEAIAEAHALGIVHRDLKPSNLFLSKNPDGSSMVKVLDFGIAKAIDMGDVAVPKLTVTGMALGTPVYMSPEQVRDAKTVDRRTDIWALGSVLHQLIAGEPPFSADTLPALCAMIVADPAKRLDQVRPGVPAELADVVQRCLSKGVDDRYPDVPSLAWALAPFARAASLAHVESIERIAARAGAAEPSIPGVPPSEGAAAREDAITVASDLRSTERAEPVAKQTASAWQTDQRDRARSGLGQPARASRRGRMLGLAFGLLAAVALATWLAARSSGPGDPQAAPAGPAAEEATAGSSSEALETAAPPAAESASGATASSTSRASARSADAGPMAPTPSASSATRPSAPTAQGKPSAVPSPRASAAPPSPSPTKDTHDSSLLDRR